MKTIEEIVMTKAFFELTDQERLQIKSLAENQEDYDKLKKLLSGTASFFIDNRVTASVGMRDHIMEKLYPPTVASLKWYQSIWLFLFPNNKAFYQYPAFQLAGVFLVFFGIFSLWQNPIKDNKLANNSIENKVEDNKKLVLIDEADYEADKKDSFQDGNQNESVNISSDIEGEAIVPETITVKEVEVEYNDEIGVLNEESIYTFDNSIITANKEKQSLSAPASINSQMSESVLAKPDLMDKMAVPVIETETTNEYFDDEKKFYNKDFDIIEVEKDRLSSNISSLKQELAKKNNSVTDIKGLGDLFFEVK